MLVAVLPRRAPVPLSHHTSSAALAGTALACSRNSGVTTGLHTSMPDIATGKRLILPRDVREWAAPGPAAGWRSGPPATVKRHDAPPAGDPPGRRAGPGRAVGLAESGWRVRAVLNRPAPRGRHWLHASPGNLLLWLPHLPEPPSVSRHDVLRRLLEKRRRWVLPRVVKLIGANIGESLLYIKGLKFQIACPHI